jgi:hypothetical protein
LTSGLEAFSLISGGLNRDIRGIQKEELR